MFAYGLRWTSWVSVPSWSILVMTPIGRPGGSRNGSLSVLETVPLAVGAAATLLFALGFALMQFLLGADAPVSWALVRQTLTTLVINTLIAVPVYAVVRRSLQGSLPDDPRRRRRRAYTTGGLSPLSRA